MILMIMLEHGGPLEFLLKWLPGVGWPAVILVVWQASRFLFKAEKRAEAVEETIGEVDKIVKETQANIAEQHELKLKLMGNVESFKESFDKHCPLVDASFSNLTNLQKTLDDHIADVSEANARLYGENATALAGAAKDLQQVLEAIKHQSEVHASQFEIMRNLAKDQATLSANQTNITAGFQRVVEQLINIVNK